jgi:hypothetical protein
MKYLLILLLLISTNCIAEPNVKMIYGLTGFGISLVGTAILPYNNHIGLTTFATGFPFVGMAIIFDNKNKNKKRNEIRN